MAVGSGLQAVDIDLGYWQSPQGEEVDFVVRVGNQVDSLIQVCWSLDDERTAKREWRALLKAGEELRCQRLVCLHHGASRREQVKWQRWQGDIEVVSLTEWLLSKPSSPHR